MNRSGSDVAFARQYKRNLSDEYFISALIVDNDKRKR